MKKGCLHNKQNINIIYYKSPECLVQVFDLKGLAIDLKHIISEYDGESC